MDNLKTGTDHIEIPFEQRLRFRGASAAGAVHVLRSLRPADSSTSFTGNRDERLKTPASPTAERAGITNNILKIFSAALLRALASTRPKCAVHKLRTDTSEAENLEDWHLRPPYRLG
ncbi:MULTISPECIES: hypothetical protein [Alphaproteobacteria]|uniref:hypothetical protein n=1 Tax=Alphaproteobacteria TaxID=28211 RepID=UPI0032656454